MMWTRRTFVRTGSLAVIGSIFVPKYERWFRSIQPQIVAPWETTPTIAAIYSPNGKILWQAPLMYRNGIFQADFPVAVKGLTLKRFALLNEKGVPLFTKEYDKVISAGDQARVTLPMINLLED